MAKSRLRFSEVDELTNEGALEHSREKYARYQDDEEKEKNCDDEGNGDDARKDYQSKHTLDSDEEEDVKYKKLDMEKIDGQEEAGLEYEGDTKIMAFNMKEDLEEGHFDADGNFIFDKKETEIKDAWLDNIDWANVKANAGDQWHQKNEEDSSTTKILGDSEHKSIYEKIASMLKSNETIERALARLGKEKGLSAAEERRKRWAAKKAGKEYVNDKNFAVKELTGLTDTLVSNGEMEAYQYTLEKVQYMIQELQSKAVDVLDMFSDEAPTCSTRGENKQTDGAARSASSVIWEYKLSNDEDAEIFGPVSSEQMMKLQGEGKFENGGWARKKGMQTFYTIARLDFEIYV
uniref:GYF domain-containing protein n=1 Tax=Elaeophora elaphi TaxID=1147741 RepID=A0A0R3RVR3_9BILA